MRILSLTAKILTGRYQSFFASAADTIFSSKGAFYLDGIMGNSEGVRAIAGSKLFWPEERPDIIASEARALWEIS